MNWAKLASDVEGEDLAAEGSMNRLAQICHSSIFVWTFSLLPGILGQLHVGFEAMHSKNLAEWQKSSSSDLQTSDQLVPNVLVQETPFLE